MKPIIETKNLTLKYRHTTAVDSVNLSLEPGKIYGLLGRNGSGKTSLLSLLAGYTKRTSGDLSVLGANPFSSQRVTARSCFIRDQLDVFMSSKAREVIEIQASLRPRFDLEYAAKLVDIFNLDLSVTPQYMSKGQQSALGIVIGLASRAEVNYFDEVYLGLDAPSRYKFYEELLLDYTEHPRTFILSSHFIDELERVLEDVIIMDEGKILLQQPVEELKNGAISIIGPDTEVRAAAAGQRIIAEQKLGGTTQLTLYGDFTAAQRAEFERQGLQLSVPSVQDLFVFLTEKERD